VLYHVLERSVERRVLPYCRRHGIALVAYSPFGQGDFPSVRSRGGQTLEMVARRHEATPRQVALAFLTRGDGVFAIPKAEVVEHVRDNAGAGDLVLTPEEVADIDAAFPVGNRRALLML